MATSGIKVSRNTKRERTVPPDGGWGWYVLFGYIVTGIAIIPIIQNFGLIFKSRLLDIGLSSTDITTIISMNSSIGQILGLFLSPLLKNFGYRKIAFVGVSFFTIGTILTGFSYSFTSFMVTYGIITSIGFTYTLTSFSLAINSYFKKKRSRVSGLQMGFTGLGPVLMPQIVTWSLGTYGTVSTSFILAGITAQSFIGVCLLRPVKWYLKYPEDVNAVENKLEEEEDENDEMDEKIRRNSVFLEEVLGAFDPNARRRSSSQSNRSKRAKTASESEPSPENEAFLKTLHEEEQPTQGSQQYLKPARFFDNDDDVADGMKSTLDLMDRMPPMTFASVETLDSINNYSVENLAASISNNRTETGNESSAQARVYVSRWRKVGRWFNEQFDFDLLKDPVYVSIMVGLSVAVIGELMFSILTPFILYEVGLDIQMAAYFMSITAVSDIVSRFLSPYIAECIKIRSPRVMYIIALSLLFITRSSLLFVTGTVGLAIVAVGVGFAKGVRTVFWGLVLPHHVPMAKLGSAMAFQNLVNGILIFFAGPISGLIVEINNSYLNIIYVSNTMTAITILMWVLEWIISPIIAAKKIKGNIHATP